MRKSERDKRNYIIIGLCAIVAVMAIGFAAFNQQLKINSTSEVTSTWCVGFDTTKTSDYVATAGLDGGTLPTASMSYNGNTCGSDNLQTGASLSASFKQPGDQVVYTFTIKNASTLNAKLDSINENITTSNSAIEYELSGASEGDVLGANDTTTLVVTVRYKSSITSQPDTTAWGLSIKLNFSQTNESAGGSGGGSNVINGRTIDQTFVPQYYEYHSGDWVTVGNSVDTATWTEDPTTLTGRTYYLGHDVDSTTGKVDANYACFVINDTQYCMRGKDGSSGTNYWTQNKDLLGSLKDAGTITCSTFDASTAVCRVGGLGYLYADSYGGVYAGASSSVYCHASYNGRSICRE